MDVNQRQPAFAAIVVVVTLLGIGCGKHEAATPAQVVAGLYRTLASVQVRGAPSAEQLALIAPYLSSELQGQLRAARALHDREQAQSPAE